MPFACFEPANWVELGHIGGGERGCGFRFLRNEPNFALGLRPGLRNELGIRLAARRNRLLPRAAQFQLRQGVQSFVEGALVGGLVAQGPVGPEIVAEGIDCGVCVKSSTSLEEMAARRSGKAECNFMQGMEKAECGFCDRIVAGHPPKSYAGKPFHTVCRNCGKVLTLAEDRYYCFPRVLLSCLFNTPVIFADISR